MAMKPTWCSPVQLGSLGRCLPVSSSWIPFVSSCLGSRESPEGAMFQLSEEVNFFCNTAWVPSGFLRWKKV